MKKERDLSSIWCTTNQNKTTLIHIQQTSCPWRALFFSPADHRERTRWQQHSRKRMALGLWRSLDIGLQTVHVNGTVVFVFIVLFVMVWRQMRGLPVRGPDALLQLHETGHIGRQVLGFPYRARRRGLKAAVFLIGYHLLEVDHGLGLTDERNL